MSPSIPQQQKEKSFHINLTAYNAIGIEHKYAERILNCFKYPYEEM
jgi:hypothetical protein